MAHFNLSGDSILIVGGAGLIGSAVSQGLTDHEADVYLCDLPESRGADIASELGAGVTFVPMDVTDPDDVSEQIAHLDSEAGGIDGLVNCSYPRNEAYGADFWDASFDAWVENLQLHAGSYFFLAREVARRMKQRGIAGSIVNFASIYGEQAPDFSVYSGTNTGTPSEYVAIKGAIVNVTRYLASLLGQHEIRVNAVSPGGVFDKQNETFVENYEQRVPLGRMATPEDLIGPVVFLLSDAASYVTGHNLLVDGGWTIS